MRSGTSTNKRMSNPASASSRSAQRVLLVDDDELVCESLRHYLVLQGYAVDVAVDRASADVLMHAQQYAVVVVDPYLTGGVHRDNTELLDRVCRMQRRAAVILLTAYESPALLRVASEHRVSAVHSKPQSVIVLERLIRGAVAVAHPPEFHHHEEPML